MSETDLNGPLRVDVATDGATAAGIRAYLEARGYAVVATYRAPSATVNRVDGLSGDAPDAETLHSGPGTAWVILSSHA